jgi:hypothetical protein
MKNKDFFGINLPNTRSETDSFDVNIYIVELFKGLFDEKDNDLIKIYKDEYDSFKNVSLDSDTVYEQILNNFVDYKIPELAKIFSADFMLNIKNINDLIENKYNGPFSQLKYEIIDGYLKKTNECFDNKKSIRNLPSEETIPFKKEHILSNFENVIRNLRSLTKEPDPDNEWTQYFSEAKRKRHIIFSIGILQNSLNEYNKILGDYKEHSILENINLPTIKP